MLRAPGEGGEAAVAPGGRGFGRGGCGRRWASLRTGGEGGWSSMPTEGRGGEVGYITAGID